MKKHQNNSQQLRLLGMVVFLFTCTLLSAQTGPGGVGNSTSNPLWLSADSSVFTDAGTTSATNGNTIQQWNDISGNSNNASQTTAGYKTTFITGGVNGLPVVRFDGTDDYFDDPNSYSARSIYAVYSVSSALQASTDLGQIWGNYGEDVHVAIDARAGNLQGWSFDGGGANQGKYSLNSSNFGGFAEDNNTSPWTYDQFEIVSIEFDATRAVTRQVLGSLFPNFAVGTHQYGGDVAEILVFNTTHNAAQKIIIENYLAAKYEIDISASANDFYAYSTTHRYNVAGIGRFDAGQTHTNATSAHILNISNPSGLDADGEYLFFGHENANSTTWTTAEAPNAGTNIQRLNREWRITETGEVGSVSFTIDTSGFNARPANYTKFVLLIDADGDFSAGANTYELTSAGGDEFYSINGINIDDGDFISIGCLRPTIEFTTADSSGSEAITNSEIKVELNYITASDVTIDYLSSDGTALEPGDYSSLNSTLTITSGNTSNTITLSVINDVDLENNESFAITISNPSAGINLGTKTIHTYSIEDDDNPRKISFNSATSSGDEASSPASITVEINLVDAVNPTSVDYAVSGGTATGGNTDYSLASGTLTIPASSTDNTFDITINNDVLNETDETIIITLSNPINCNLSSTNPIAHTYTITDNDPAPTVQFSSTSSSGGEATPSVNFEISLSAISGTDVSIDYDLIGGTATVGSDFTLSNGTLTIPAGDLTATITATVVNDNVQEVSETIEIELSNPINATMGANTIHTYSIIDDDPFGFLGPAGVGDNTSNTLWLRADMGVYNDGGVNLALDGESIQEWQDQSGNNNSASQSTIGYRPTYLKNVLNTLPVVRFDGTDDYFDDNNNYSARSIYVVYRASSITQGTSELAQLWGSYTEGTHLALDPRAGGNVRGWSFDGNGGSEGKYGINGAAYSAFVANGNSNQWTYDQFQMVAAEFDGTKTISRQVIGSLVPGFAVGAHQYGGDIAEIIIFSTAINDAQRIIIENYLSSKYGIAISNDKFSHDTGHGNQVTGIGREDGNNLHLDAQGTGIVRINNPSSLDDGDYLIWGDDSATLSLDTTDVPASIDNRLHRTYRISETGDIGTVTLFFDLSDFTVADSSKLVLLIDSDDGSFVNASSHTTGFNYESATKTVSFSDVDFSNGNWFTIASSTDDNPLPVQLLSFTAKCQDENLFISWSTATELNNAYFSLQQSTDAIHWTELAQIKGAGNSNGIKSYSFLIEDAPSTASYYRIVQFDTDNKANYYKIISDSCHHSKANILVHPNPSKGIYNLTWQMKNLDFNFIQVFDSFGKQIFESSVVVNQLNLSAQSNGIYFIKVSTKNSILWKKIILQK